MSSVGQMIAGAAGSVGVGLIGNVVTGAINNAYAKQQWNREVAQEQSTYERNRADYLADLENERAYNSPSAQLERMREAGMNPNLANGGQLISGAVSSGAQTMNNGISPSGKVFAGDNIGSTASGVASFSNAQVAMRKADEEIVSLKLSNQYQRVQNEFLRAEKELSLSKVQTEIDSILANTKKTLSDIDLNNSTIKVNGKRIQLIDKNMNKLDAEIALTRAKEIIENLNAEKMRIMMPFVEKQTLAEIELKKARTKEAKAAAAAHYAQASLATVKAASEQSLIDAGYAEHLVSEMESRELLNDANAYITNIESMYVGKAAKAKERASKAAMVSSIGSIIKNVASALLDFKGLMPFGAGGSTSSGSDGGDDAALMGLFM